MVALRAAREHSQTARNPNLCVASPVTAPSSPQAQAQQCPNEPPNDAERADDRRLLENLAAQAAPAADQTAPLSRTVRAWGLEILCAEPREYSNSLTAVLMPQGHDADELEIVLGQLVTILKAGDVVRMGKRSGNFVELAEVVDEVYELFLDLDADGNARPCHQARFVHVGGMSVCLTAAGCGIQVPLSLRQDILGFGNGEGTSVRRRLLRMLLEC